MLFSTDSSETQPQTPLERYYRLHSKIYDATRWTFLFGRKAILDRAAALAAPTRILEIGCGTGKNLVHLCRLFPAAAMTGLDLSEAMLQVARKNLGPLQQRVTLLPMAYRQPLQPEHPFELIVCSYSLSMINPGWDDVLDSATADLTPGGLIAVVDFHDSRGRGFKTWMGLNHVQMEGHLLPGLRARFTPKLSEIHPAYAGLWEYLLFIGAKSEP